MSTYSTLLIFFVNRVILPEYLLVYITIMNRLERRT